MYFFLLLLYMPSIDKITSLGFNLHKKNLKTNNKSFFYYADSKSFYSFNNELGYIIVDNEGNKKMRIYGKTALYNNYISQTTSQHLNRLVRNCIYYGMEYDIISNKVIGNYKKFINEDEDYKCPITLEEFKDGYITNCNHKFSKKAFEIWKNDNNGCPYCRNII